MSAIFSPCRKYRYRLDREISPEGSKVFAFFGINPSKADEQSNDPTVTRIIAHAKSHDARSVIVANVFGWIDPDVNALASLSDPVGPDRNKYLSGIIDSAAVLVACWGNKSKVPPSLHHHFDQFLDVLLASGKPVMCLARNKSGDPKHPLYVRYGTPLSPYTQN